MVCLPEEGRDGPGKWLKFRHKQSLIKQTDLDFLIMKKNKRIRFVFLE